MRGRARKQRLHSIGQYRCHAPGYGLLDPCLFGQVTRIVVALVPSPVGKQQPAMRIHDRNLLRQEIKNVFSVDNHLGTLVEAYIQ